MYGWFGCELKIFGPVHEFFVPVSSSVKVAKPTTKEHLNGDSAHGTASSVPQHYRVWGMTARVIVDAARIAYNREPEFPHSASPGDEEMITSLRVGGRLGPVVRRKRRLDSSAKAKLS